MRLKQDVAAGIIFAGAGVAGLWLGSEYELGSARTMGPGYMPTILCWLLIALGGLIALKDLFVAGEDVQLGRIRPFVLVLASVAVFALTIESFGLAIAVFATAVLAAFAGEKVRKLETLALALILAACAAGVFIYGLSLPLSAFPSFGQ